MSAIPTDDAADDATDVVARLAGDATSSTRFGESPTTLGRRAARPARLGVLTFAGDASQGGRSSSGTALPPRSSTVEKEEEEAFFLFSSSGSCVLPYAAPE
jgi:hypothetical protein